MVLIMLGFAFRTYNFSEPINASFTGVKSRLCGNDDFFSASLALWLEFYDEHVPMAPQLANDHIATR